MVVLRNIVQSEMVMPIGMYRRVSIDKALKGVASTWREVQEQVKEQDEAIRHFVDTDLEMKRRGAVIVRDYCDNDTPASDPHIVREDFENLLRDLEAGIIHGVAFLHADRLARLVYDAARVCRVFEMNPTYIGRSVEGSVDLSTVEGRGMFVMQATMGNMEIGNIKRRTKRTNGRIARKGAMHSAPRAFGWGDDRKTLHETEAPFLLANIRAVPGGLKVGTFRTRLVEFGYTPQRQKNSREDGVRQVNHSVAEEILTNPRNAGFRLYVPQDVRRTSGRLWLPDFIVNDANGNPVMGDWERACSVTEYWACVNELKRRKDARKEGTNGEAHETSVKYLLSGIARCGKCLTPMWSNPYTPGTTSYENWGYRYACLTSQGGCGGVTRCGPPIDDLVEEAFLKGTRTGLGDAVEKAASEIDETTHDARLAEIAKELEEVKQRRKDKRITTSAALDLIEELEQEKKKLSSRKSALSQEKKKSELLSPDALRDWPSLSMDEKRTRLTQTIKSVIIHPMGRGKSFDPAFIEIVWHEVAKRQTESASV
ncbi:recombinase family protein [Streptomyces sp. NPDC047525]|uniref:recombinase family protein n=1 Tax=Streptomyces sp. NPDC047525 TaxID=3155264 RepID=UPI00341071C3